jgi:hypothetical protein
VGRSAPAFRSAPSFRSAPAFHGGFASPAGHYGASRGPISNGSRPLSLSPVVHTQRPNFYSRPNFYNRRPGYSAGLRYRRPYYGAGIPYVSGWVDPDYLDYPDNGGYDSSANPPDDSINGYTPQGTDQGAPPPYTEQASAEPRPAALPAPPPENEEAVTLIFKDGRPAEQIHNYALTRTTLYVSDGHRRDIPVDQLDLAATEKANHDAGVDFHIPGATQ